MNLLSNLAAFWNLLLLLCAACTLFGFLYFFVFRRLVRARRISAIRDRRLLREAAERESQSRDIRHENSGRD
jgi:hypothetical protein